MKFIFTYKSYYSVVFYPYQALIIPYFIVNFPYYTFIYPYYVVIPKPIREQLHISTATELLFDVEDDKVIMAKRSDREVISELLTRWKKKTLPPQNIDWDKLIYSQYEA
ncbi:AbrB/MazE/SpoVT family DNA-binding domain-containing protein [Candidatus Woesearchaeota archaeon]|nr:AbrB/MazE/SpoVT family DNA-binding domain-containing protein [Candidatus Woesearchaeota archaeon]